MLSTNLIVICRSNFPDGRYRQLTLPGLCPPWSSARPGRALTAPHCTERPTGSSHNKHRPPPHYITIKHSETFFVVILSSSISVNSYLPDDE